MSVTKSSMDFHEIPRRSRLSDSDNEYRLRVLGFMKLKCSNYTTVNTTRLVDVILARWRAATVQRTKTTLFVKLDQVRFTYLTEFVQSSRMSGLAE